MKKIAVAVLLGTLALTASMPAGARTIATKRYTVRFAKAPVPCTAVCSYWMEEFNNSDANLKFEACSAPFPTGSYTDIVMRAPRYSRSVKIVAHPTIDWDTFLCTKPARGNNGKQITSGANSVNPECVINCKETMRVPVTAGRAYVLRSYNWSDATDMPVTVYWLS